MKTTYVETLEHAGLRLVGYSDEISNLRHKGWFTDDEFQEDTYRGAVVQLPGRKGHAVLLPAYQESCNGGFIVDFSDVTLVKVTDEYLKDEGETRTVARIADSMAERDAERERDYQHAWRAGSNYARLQEEIAETRTDTLRVLTEFRAARKLGALDFKALCATIRKSISFMLARISKDREERDRLVSEGYFRGDLASAFNEGAGETVVKP